MATQRASDLATNALEQLIYARCSAETGVRSVLRIASLCGHSWWQSWALLQLFEGGADDLTSSYGRELERRGYQTDSVFADVVAMRSLGGTRVARHSVGELERLVCKGDNQQYRYILSRITNRVQIYLMAVEAEKEPPSPPSEIEMG